MKHLLFISVIFISFSMTSKAQMIEYAIYSSVKKEIDEGYIRAFYNFSMLDSTRMDSDGSKKRYDHQCLEIGYHLSKYYSYALSVNDSLCKEWRKKNPNAQTAPLWLYPDLKMEDWWAEYIWSVYFKDFTTNQFTEYAQMPSTISNYQSLENIPIQNWEISKGILTVINGYLCQKASCHFRGREFIAWFTQEIPISNGPWKFGGLHGLIMKVYDKDELYIYECTKVEQLKFKIYAYDYSEFEKMDRIELWELQKDMHQNFFKHSKMKLLDGSPIPAHLFPTTLYQPLELE